MQLDTLHKSSILKDFLHNMSVSGCSRAELMGKPGADYFNTTIMGVIIKLVVHPPPLHDKLHFARFALSTHVHLFWSSVASLPVGTDLT